MNTTEVRFKSAESSVLENTVGVAEEEFAQSNMEKEKKMKKNKIKNEKTSLQKCRKHSERFRCAAGIVTILPNLEHIFSFLFSCRKKTDVYLREEKG